MKFKVLLGAALTVTLVNITLAIGDINVCTNICAGSNVSCKNQALNCGSSHQEEGGGLSDLLNSAVDINDRFYDWGSLKSVRTENLGRIKGDMINFSTYFPATGQKKIIKFTPTMGDLAGKEVRLLFVSFDLNSNRFPTKTPDKLSEDLKLFKEENKRNDIRYKSSVHIFGQIEDGKKMWYDTGSINLSSDPDDKDLNVTMQAMANGKIVITDADLLNQTGADGAKARVAPIELDFSKIPEMMSN